MSPCLQRSRNITKTRLKLPSKVSNDRSGCSSPCMRDGGAAREPCRLSRRHPYAGDARVASFCLSCLPESRYGIHARGFL